MTTRKKRDAGSVEERYEEVKLLVAIGRERGFLSYEEINEVLPDEISASSEEIPITMTPLAVVRRSDRAANRLGIQESTAMLANMRGPSLDQKTSALSETTHPDPVALSTPTSVTITLNE